MEMDSYINTLVKRLMQIFEVTQPELEDEFTKQLIESARRPANRSVNSIDTSLNVIQGYTGSGRTRDLYDEFMQSNGGLREVDGILHLASKLGIDDNIRKSIKIDNPFCEAKAKRQSKQPQPQQQQNQQQQQQHHQLRSQQPQQFQCQPPMHHKLIPHHTPRPQPSLSQHHRLPPPPSPPLQVQQPQPQQHANGLQTPSVRSNSYLTNKSVRETPLHYSLPIYETPRQERNAPQNTYQTPSNMSNSMVAITPACYNKTNTPTRLEELASEKKQQQYYWENIAAIGTAILLILAFTLLAENYTSMPEDT